MATKQKEPEFIEITVFVAVNSDGEHTAHSDYDQFCEDWNQGGSDTTLPKPKATVVTAVMPEEVTDDVEAVVS